MKKTSWGTIYLCNLTLSSQAADFSVVLWDLAHYKIPGKPLIGHNYPQDIMAMPLCMFLLHELKIKWGKKSTHKEKVKICQLSILF